MMLLTHYLQLSGHFFYYGCCAPLWSASIKLHIWHNAFVLSSLLKSCLTAEVFIRLIFYAQGERVTFTAVIEREASAPS